MPIKYFTCPDDFTCLIEDCLIECRMKTPCLSLPSRIGVSRQRPFRAVVSPSQAGKGVRQIYLEGTEEYTINPRSKMFMLYGTKHHALKEELGESKMLDAFLEEKLSDDLGEGTSDYMDGDLLDFKLTGSYAIAKRAIFKEEATGELYQKAGTRTDIDGNKVTFTKGAKKYRKVWAGWNIKPDDDWALQLNRYRMMWENAGFPVRRILVEATLRDGGVRASSSYGLDGQVVMMEIPILDDEHVMRHYRKKQALLVAHVESKTCPPRCSYDERWEGRRCEGYCDVFTFCVRAGGWREDEVKKVDLARSGR